MSLELTGFVISYSCGYDALRLDIGIQNCFFKNFFTQTDTTECFLQMMHSLPLISAQSCNKNALHKFITACSYIRIVSHRFPCVMFFAKISSDLLNFFRTISDISQYVF